jgi:serpin B
MAQDNEPKEIKLNKAQQQLVQSNNDFAFRLMREVQTEDSRILSPLSITFALGMLNNGAAGVTQQEINNVLGFGEAGADGINQFCRKMLTEAPALDKETRVAIANNIYMNRPYELKDEFAKKAFEYYDAQPESRDFADGQTRDVINKWGSDHTEGMIEEAIKEDEFNPNAVSYLLNALYFKGMWNNKFDVKNTTDEVFNGGIKVPMMHIIANETGEGCEFEYIENDLYQAIKLPYGTGAYLMTVYLPRQDKTVKEVLETLDGKSWQFNGRASYIDLKLPRFETSTDIDLKPVMSALGMPTAFSEDAEFPDFCNQSTFIGMMKQVAKIKVNEEGSEAAAVTIIEMDKAVSYHDMYKFHATRPFLYIISERSTGSIFFIGQYTGDGTSGIGDAARLMNKEERIKKNEDGIKYNLNGQRLTTPPTKGVYISNGKKILR